MFADSLNFSYLAPLSYCDTCCEEFSRRLEIIDDSTRRGRCGSPYTQYPPIADLQPIGQEVKKRRY
jgi:hypothetical protein